MVLWVRLCTLSRLDPASASVDRLHAALGRCVGRGTIQRISEGVPPRLSSLQRIAEHLRVNVDVLLRDTSATAPAPPAPPRDFSDRREVSETDWALLEAVKVMLPDEERDNLVRKHRALMERVAAHVAKANSST